MKHPVGAAAALAVGLGFAGAALAAGTTPQTVQPSMPVQGATAGQPTQAMQQPAQRITRQDIRQAQQQLKSEGLYKGPADGVDGRATRHAIAEFQRKNGLPHTAKLDQGTLARLTGGQGVGVGSSTPNGSTGSNATGSTTTPTPLMPPATQAPGAGDNAPPSKPNTTHY